MIPRIIHQTSRTMEIPRHWRGYQSAVKAFHPGWEYRHWTDGDNLRLVEKTAPHRLPLYMSLPKGVMKADMIRYVYMEIFGGLYLDFDYELMKPFDLLDERIVVPRENDDDAEPYLGNSVLASEPGHRFWADVLRELEKGLAALGREPVEEEVAGITGPGLVTRVYRQHAPEYPELNFVRRENFNPYYLDDQGLAALIKAGNLYGIHHCDGTWRAKSLPQRALRKLASLKSRRKG